MGKPGGAATTRAKRPVVAIVYRYIPQYRREFYELLRERLDDRGVDLRLLYGQPSPRDVTKKDAIDLAWATRIDNVVFPVGTRELYWQRCLRQVWDADLLVVEQASKLLVNYVLLAARSVGGPKVAFWGHGANIQQHLASTAGEVVKRLISRRVDWWFAYNLLSVDVVANLGFAPERTTCVQNAIDTRHLQEARARVTDAELDALRAELGIRTRNVGVFAGAIYRDKRLPFLVASADRVRRSVPDFELIVIGAGYDAPGVEAAAAARPWMHYVGPKFGDEKVRLMALAKVMLIPGLVGLVILDAFALELPLLTTNISYHSHEVGYLEHGDNGLMVDDRDDPDAYAEAIARAMLDDQLLARLQAGCRASAKRYTVESMAERYADGVVMALETERAGAW